MITTKQLENAINKIKGVEIELLQHCKGKWCQTCKQAKECDIIIAFQEWLTNVMDGKLA